MKTEDGAIIYKCLNGDREAFAILIDKYKAGIYAYICAKLNNMDDAEDVTQEVFIRAYRDLQKLRRWDSFAYWLYSIATCQCRNWIRAKSRRPDHNLIEDQDPSKLEKILAERAIESSKDKKIDESLHEALDSLPEIYREVLMLYYMSGMNSEQIANMLAISPESIRQRLTRARAMLREEIITMMDRTLPQHKLQASFTFRIVEAIKRIKISPSAQTRGLPLGLSLATGILIAVLSINPAFINFKDISTPIFAPLPSESKVLNIGEIPVDVVKTSNIMMLSNAMGNGKGGKQKQPDMENAFFMAPQGDGKWEKRADMPTARDGLCTVVVDDKIYAIGGWQPPDKKISNVEEYDPINNKWEIKSNMLENRYWFSANSVNGKIYAFGGLNENAMILSSVEEYDPTNNKWKKKKDMPRGMAHQASCVIGSKIYFIAPENDFLVYEYDFVEDSWVEKTTMPTSRYLVALCAVNDKLYIIGGFDWNTNIGLSTVEEYDLINDIWTKKADMPTGRGSLATCVVGNKIYALGGTKNLADGGLKTVEIYDTLTDTWEKHVDMLSPKWAFSVSVVNSKIYSIGGYNWGVLATVEEYDTGYISKSVDPSGKLPQTWGNLKAK